MNKIYKKGSSCRKCGERGASSKYWDGYPENTQWLPFGGIPDDFEPEPAIIRECLNCGFKWREEPLNNIRVLFN